ncbi:hypothetical protein BOX15_Mlig014292g1 [Macrostomum lignano]|uniref:EGF-like domain-containing protein n=1 Tax=Macrostomum lignano TaxID=282301 RepID=A0A267EXJ0_9PLAT|nr:hypothetical protein BOX15_Mlig014292g1 [Macrostomum lignano]
MVFVPSSPVLLALLLTAAAADSRAAQRSPPDPTRPVASELGAISPPHVIKIGELYYFTDSGRCTRPGETCSDPQGGVCVASGSNLICECPSSHTVVRHKDRRACQTKLLDVPCRRDNDYACAQVKDSVCAPNEARCVCPTDTVYAAHRHQCKHRYSNSPQPQYCKSCESEGGVCFKEDEVAESSGPVLTEGGLTFRLGCACPGNRGTARIGKVDTWVEPICSTRLRDIGDPCDDSQLLCRSKRAICGKPRDTETDIRKCRCPDRYVAVYQQWLHYYECFKTLDLDSEHCRECKAAKQYGQCYAATNSTETGCLCPKRLSTPNVEGATVKQYCSKQHVSVSCHSKKMVVKFDPNYDNPPYDQLRERLTSKNSTAFIGSYGSLQQQQQVCRLHPTPDGVYTAILALDSNSACGRGIVQRTRYPTYQVLEATLKVMWDRNFHTYPDIIVDIECRVPESGAGSEVGLPVGDPMASFTPGSPRTARCCPGARSPACRWT